MRALILAAAFACLAATPALAAPPRPVPDSGFSGHAAQARYTGPEAAAFAKQIEHDLAAKGARVAIVFRTGRPRDKLPEGIAYTHGAFWVYTDITGADGNIYKVTSPTTSIRVTANPCHGTGHTSPRIFRSISSPAIRPMMWASSFPRRKCSAAL
jgi:hypothetical protein